MASLSDCTPVTNIRAPELGWPFANELSNVTMGGFGSNPGKERDQPSSSPSRTENAAKRPHILLAEDSKTDVYLIREALGSVLVDADLHVVSDGNAATRFMDAADADENSPCPVLVLLDLNLPKKTGEEVLKHLRQSRRCRHAKVLIVSSSDGPRDRASVADLAISGYFKKPSEYAEFMKLGPLVRSLLEMPIASVE